MYLLDGGTDVDSKVGQRVEVDGMLGPRVAAPPTRLSTARPVLQIRVSHMRAVAPHC